MKYQDTEVQGMKLGSIHWTDSLLEAPDYCQSVPRLSHRGRGVGSYELDTSDRHYNVTGRPFLPRMYEALFSITFTFIVDINLDIFLLELVFRGGECSVASSRRLYRLSQLLRTTLQAKAQQQVNQIITPSKRRPLRGCQGGETSTDRSSVLGILGIVVVQSLFYCHVSV